MQTCQIDGCSNDLCIFISGFFQSPGRSGDHSASCIGTDRHGRLFSIPVPHFPAYFISQCLNTCHSKRRIQGGVEISCILHYGEMLIEQLRSYGQLYHFSSQSLAFPSFFYDLRLSYSSGIIALLYDYGLSGPSLRPEKLRQRRNCRRLRRSHPHIPVFSPVRRPGKPVCP